MNRKNAKPNCQLQQADQTDKHSTKKPENHVLIHGFVLKKRNKIILSKFDLLSFSLCLLSPIFKQNKREKRKFVH